MCFSRYNDYVRRAGHWQKIMIGILDAGFEDLNGDGCVHEADPQACPVPEPIYARFDFNGDGVISREARADFNGSLLTDLEVLMSVWGSGPSAETEGWNLRDLPTLLNSADVHFDLTSLGDFDHIKMIATGLPERTVPSGRTVVTVTIPAGKSLHFELQGWRGGVVALRRCARAGPLEPGQDLWASWTAC